MKKIITFITLFILSTTSVWAEIALYTTDNKEARPVSDMYSILTEFSEHYKDKNILFYVHGRKKHLIDEINKMPILESRYNVKVVMLHWDSYDTLLSRPVKNAELTADQLYESFEQIKKFKEDNPTFFGEHTINLLCHSMGNLVLKYTVEKYYANANASDKATENKIDKLFTNYISVGADVPLKNHSEWLSKFDLAEQNYIMMNNRDIVLLLSYMLDLKEHTPLNYRLGLGFDNYPGWRDNIKNKLVPTTTYIDLSKVLISEHGYYLGKNAIMRTIFNRLVNGESFIAQDKESDNFRYSQDRKDKNVFYIKKD